MHPNPDPFQKLHQIIRSEADHNIHVKWWAWSSKGVNIDSNQVPWKTAFFKVRYRHYNDVFEGEED